MIDVTAEHLGGRILATGAVRSRTLRTENAFDIGDRRGRRARAGLRQRVPHRRVRRRAPGDVPRRARDPLGPQTGRIISIANLREGDEVAVLHVPKANVPLGDGVREPSVYPEVEAMLGKPLAEYALA